MKQSNKIIDTTLVPHTAFIDATSRIEQCFSYAEGSCEPVCIALIGESRTGKSRVLEECYIKHPKIRSKERLEVPILRVSVQSTPTIKGLAEQMLYSIGDPLYATGTENIKAIRLRTLIGNAGTQMIMLDEFQHFYDKKLHKVSFHVTDWLKILIDDCKVALVVAGLPTCEAVLAQNEQLVGRFLAPINMPRFDWKNSDQRQEFIAILGAFHESLSTQFDLPELDQPAMAFRCYCATGGIIGYLTKFLRQVECNALYKGVSRIDLEDLLIAHNQAVWTKASALSLPSPFSREFNITPTAKLLAEIQLIGTPVKEEPKPRKIRSKTASKRATVSSVLVGS